MAQDIVEAIAQPADVVMVTRDFKILLAAIVESVPALVAEVAISITTDEDYFENEELIGAWISVLEEVV